MVEKELSNIEVIHLIQELKRMEKAEDPKSWRENIFRQIPKEFKVTVCLGCGRRYEDRDCGCPAGSAENLREDGEITDILLEREEEGCNVKITIDKMLSDMLDNIIAIDVANRHTDGSYEAKNLDIEDLIVQLHNQWVSIRCEVDKIFGVEKAK